LSAAPDAGWPDCFNSGVFVFSPSKETFDALLDFALTHGSFDGMFFYLIKNNLIVLF
jgi:glycogenin glucosyltransferase